MLYVMNACLVRKVIFSELGLEMPMPRMHIRVTMPRDSAAASSAKFAQAMTFKQFNANLCVIEVSNIHCVYDLSPS
jgi:hypothetical protein